MASFDKKLTLAVATCLVWMGLLVFSFVLLNQIDHISLFNSFLFFPFVAFILMSISFYFMEVGKLNLFFAFCLSSILILWYLFYSVNRIQLLEKCGFNEDEINAIIFNYEYKNKIYDKCYTNLQKENEENEKQYHMYKLEEERKQNFLNEKMKANLDNFLKE